MNRERRSKLKKLRASLVESLELTEFLKADEEMSMANIESKFEEHPRLGNMEAAVDNLEEVEDLLRSAIDAIDDIP